MPTRFPICLQIFPYTRVKAAWNKLCDKRMSYIVVLRLNLRHHLERGENTASQQPCESTGDEPLHEPGFGIMITTRSASTTASSMSCVTKMTVLSCARQALYVPFYIVQRTFQLLITSRFIQYR